MMGNVGLKKTPPPVHLAGAKWMKQHAEQQRVKLHSGMTAGTLLAATRQIPNMSDDRLKLLAEDIHAVLTAYSDNNQDLRKPADRYFRTTYAKLFEKESYSFENKTQRNMMTSLRDLIRSQTFAKERPVSVAAATSVAPVAPVAPIKFPGFNPIATNQAFEFIRNAYLERVQIEHNNPAVPMPTSPEASWKNRIKEIQRVIKVSATPLSKIKIDVRSLRPGAFIKSLATNKPAPHMPATQASASANPGDQSADAQRRADEAIRRAVADMASGNAKFMKWLEQNNIEAVTNNGYGLNCLIIALLQHATGGYGNEFEPALAAEAQKIRRKLNIDDGMLYSDDTTASKIVGAINADHHTNMVLVEVQADEAGQPVIPILPDQLSERDRVVVWQKGNHFEALRAKDARAAS